MAGNLGFIGVGVNSVSQSSETVRHYVPILSETMQAGREFLDQEVLQGRWDVGKRYGGLHRVSGGVMTDVHPIAAGFLMRPVFDTTTAAQDYTINGKYFCSSVVGVRCHIFRLEQNIFQTGSGSDLPTVTMEAFRGEKASGGDSQVYYRLAGNAAEFSVEAAQLAKMNFEYTGLDHGMMSRSTQTFPAAEAFPWSQASLEIGGAAFDTLESITVRVENPLEAVPFINASDRCSMIKRTGFRNVTVNGRVTYTSNSEYMQFTTGSERNLTLTFAGVSLPQGSATNTTRLAMILPAFQYSTYPLNISGAGRQTVDFTGRGIYHEGSATACEFILVNTRHVGYDVNSKTT
jgi:hypothetical protein